MSDGQSLTGTAPRTSGGRYDRTDYIWIDRVGFGVLAFGLLVAVLGLFFSFFGGSDGGLFALFGGVGIALVGVPVMALARIGVTLCEIRDRG